MASGSFYTGGISVAPLSIAQPAAYNSGSFTSDTPIADLSANAAATAHAAAQQPHGQAAPAPAAAKPSAAVKAQAAGVLPKGTSTGDAFAMMYDNMNLAKPPQDASAQPGAQAGTQQPPSTGSTALTAATPGAENIPQNKNAATIGGTPVSLSDWAIQHLMDHYNESAGSGGTAQAGGPGAQP